MLSLPSAFTNPSGTDEDFVLERLRFKKPMLARFFALRSFMKRAARTWSLEAACLGFWGDFSFLVAAIFGGATGTFEPCGFVPGNCAVFIIMHGAAMLSVAPLALRLVRVGVEVKILRDEGDTDRKTSKEEEGEGEAEAFFWCEALRARVNCRGSSLLTLSFAKRVESQPITSSLFSLCLCKDLEDHGQNANSREDTCRIV
jgi:hypothetical protein